MAHRVDGARKLLPVPRGWRRGRRPWHLCPRRSRGLLRRLGIACVVRGSHHATAMGQQRRLYARGWAAAAQPRVVGKASERPHPGQGRWRAGALEETNIAPSLVAALPRATWCVARWDEAARRFKPRGAAAAAGCASTACDLQAYTRGFEPRSDVLLTDQVGTALLLLADLTLSKIAPEIASGQCERVSSAGVPPPRPLTLPSTPQLSLIHAQVLPVWGTLFVRVFQVSRRGMWAARAESRSCRHCACPCALLPSPHTCTYAAHSLVVCFWYFCCAMEI